MNEKEKKEGENEDEAMTDEVKREALMTIVDISEINLMSREIRNKTIHEVKRKDYGMIIGNMRIIEEMIKGSVKEEDKRKEERERINRFVKTIIELQEVNGQYYLIEGIGTVIPGKVKQEGR